MESLQSIVAALTRFLPFFPFTSNKEFVYKAFSMAGNDENGVFYCPQIDNN